MEGGWDSLAPGWGGGRGRRHVGERPEKQLEHCVRVEVMVKAMCFIAERVTSHFDPIVHHIFIQVGDCV